ncbi:ribbon-helix-helix domain-containing protein [Undibacterium parvum]|uniref:Aryl-sulfate sulfotransferase n=1 Tax=Undibacterium parvum TaxID=401471 RepID=A0A3Q9BPU3_9BURK|nr:ribbon-helix-helix domain-containing protein [Undibacterium parvum]AZP11781.1 aryl-sulfate sulfotransferase [Undibacterium parvum]
MCDIFVKADPALYQAKARSLRLHGVVTSIRLEQLFWQVLQEVAERDGMNTNQLIAKLHDELIAYRGQIENFSSFLRVCCLRYLSLMADGDVPRDKQLPLSALHNNQNTQPQIAAKTSAYLL